MIHQVRLAVTAFAVLLLPPALGAQTPATVQPQSPPPRLYTASTTDSTVIALRAQVTEMREFRQDVLATVYWALSIAGGVTFLLVGYSWFTNSRNYERERENMRAALKNELETDLRALRDEMAIAQKAHGEQLEALAKKATQTEAAKIESSVSNVSYQLSEVREELIELQIERAMEQKRGWRALSGRLKLLKMRKSEAWDTRIADELDSLSKLLHADWFTMDADDAAEVMSTIDGLSSAHAADVDAIRLRVKKLRSPS